MQITSGKLARINIKSCIKSSARPTSSRLRTNICNILTHNYHELLSGATLDAFAGFGTMSFELLSIGCKDIVAFEQSPYTFKILVENRQKIISSNNDIEMVCLRKDVLSYKLGFINKCFSIVFIDPPYAKLSYIPRLIHNLKRNNSINKNTLLILETSKKDLDFINQLDIQVIKSTQAASSVATFAHANL